MKRLAIGVDDFKKIIKEGCYYIDKTKFIEEQGKHPVIFLSLKEIKGKTW